MEKLPCCAQSEQTIPRVLSNPELRLRPCKLVRWPHAEWPRKDFSTDNATGSIVILSPGNPSAAGTQRRKALQEFPVMLVGMTAFVITSKLWSVEAMLDTAAFLTWRDCPWSLHQ
jgi:hypothetical protein